MKTLTIDDALKIEIEQHDDLYIADSKVLPGSPPIGRGKTPEEAKYDLLAKILWEFAYDSSCYKYMIVRHLKEAWNKI